MHPMLLEPKTLLFPPRRRPPLAGAGIDGAISKNFKNIYPRIIRLLKKCTVSDDEKDQQATGRGTVPPIRCAKYAGPSKQKRTAGDHDPFF